MDAPIKAAATPPVDLPDGRRICKRCEVPKPIDQFDKDSGARTGRRADCKPCRSAYMTGYYAENMDERKAYMRERLLNNGDRVRELDSARYVRDRQKRAALAAQYGQIRRARMAGREYEKGISLKALRERDGGDCCHCGVEMVFRRFKSGEGVGTQATIEHLVPISRGGTHTWGNVALACRDCNFRRGAKSLDEWKPQAVRERTVATSVG